jgi:nicotinamidase-related amidase
MTHEWGDAAMRRQYELAGFGGRVGWGERPALLVIDMATAWVDPDQQLGSDLSGVMSSIRQLLAIAREGGVPIFFTTMAYGSAAEVGSVVSRKLVHLELMLRGSKRVELAPELERRPSEPLIEKPRA